MLPGPLKTHVRPVRQGGACAVSEFGGTTLGKPSIYHDRDLDRQLLIRRKEHLIDADIVVDDCRREVDAAVHRLRAAVAARDQAAGRLAALVERMAA